MIEIVWNRTRQSKRINERNQYSVVRFSSDSISLCVFGFYLLTLCSSLTFFISLTAFKFNSSLDSAWQCISQMRLLTRLNNGENAQICKTSAVQSFLESLLLNVILRIRQNKGVYSLLLLLFFLFAIKMFVRVSLWCESFVWVCVWKQNQAKAMVKMRQLNKINETLIASNNAKQYISETHNDKR